MNRIKTLVLNRWNPIILCKNACDLRPFFQRQGLRFLCCLLSKVFLNQTEVNGSSPQGLGPGSEGKEGGQRSEGRGQ